jgi:hypothetical protein
MIKNNEHNFLKQICVLESEYTKGWQFGALSQPGLQKYGCPFMTDELTIICMYKKCVWSILQIQGNSIILSI